MVQKMTSMGLKRRVVTACSPRQVTVVVTTKTKV